MRRPQMLEQELLDGTLGEELLEFLNATEFDVEQARTLHTRLREAIQLAGGEPVWGEDQDWAYQKPGL